MTTLCTALRVCAATGLLAMVPQTAIAQWPQFRGPNGSGIDTATGYPVKFSPTENVLWRVPVSSAQSSPVVVGERVYLTTSDAERLITICLDASTGRELWRREIKRIRKADVYHANDPAAPSPAADENGVVVFFEDFGLAAYTPDGKDRWMAPLGPFANFYGMAASPILVGDLVIMLCDQQKGSFLLALDAKTGTRKWRTERPTANIGWATPMIFRPGGSAPAELIVLGSTRLDSFSLDKGEPLWWMPLASEGAIGTVVAEGDTIFASTKGSAEPMLGTFESLGEPHDKDKNKRLSRQEFAAIEGWAEHFGWLDTDKDDAVTMEEWNIARNMGVGEYGAFAVRPGKAKGRLDERAVVWRFKRNLPYIPTPLLYEGALYLVKDGGIITSLDPATGTMVKQGRAPEALGQYYASPVAADQKVYLAGVDGNVTVLKAGASWEVLGVNKLGEAIRATPALSGGRIYVRTEKALYCFGAQPERKAAR